MGNQRSAVGQAAENHALTFLQQQGLTLVTRNYRCRWGEIDLIMRDRDELVFVEVRYRYHRGYGGALESVAATKQRKLSRSALHYLSNVEKCLNTPCRFDVIAQQDHDGSAGNQAQLHWIANAFELCN